MPRFRTTATPNPNSLKFTTDAGPFLEGGMAAFTSADEAAGDPLGEPLMAIDGVHDVFVLPQFLTVTKTPEADWKQVLPSVEAVLRAHFEGP